MCLNVGESWLASASAAAALVFLDPKDLAGEVAVPLVEEASPDFAAGLTFGGA